MDFGERGLHLREEIIYTYMGKHCKRPSVTYSFNEIHFEYDYETQDIKRQGIENASTWDWKKIQEYFVHFEHFTVAAQSFFPSW